MVEQNATPIMRWAGHVARMEKRRGAYGVLAVKYEGKRPIRRPRSRQASNIRNDLKEISWEVFDRVDLAQDMYKWGILVRVVMNFPVIFPVTPKAGNFLTS